MSLTFVLGGARSGKSAYALHHAEAAATGRRPVMIVTAEAHDDEMVERIARHRAERADRWTTVEAPLDLPQAIAALAPGDIAVVDCLTLWFSNLMTCDRDTGAAAAALIEALERCQATVWVISNEVGLGIVPENALARRFRDEIGRLHQAVAKLADAVILVVAGLPVRVK